MLDDDTAACLSCVYHAPYLPYKTPWTCRDCGLIHGVKIWPTKRAKAGTPNDEMCVAMDLADLANIHMPMSWGQEIEQWLTGRWC